MVLRSSAYRALNESTLVRVFAVSTVFLITKPNMNRTIPRIRDVSISHKVVNPPK